MTSKTKLPSAHLNEFQGEYTIQNETSGQEWILDAYRSLEPRNYLKEFTSQNVRPCGRPFHTSRPITILTSFLKRNSRGSAMVTLGGSDKIGNTDDSTSSSSGTTVIAACTLLVGHPGNVTPTHGDIDVLVTASPLSGPRFDIMGRESVDSVAAFYNYPHGSNARAATENDNGNGNHGGHGQNYNCNNNEDGTRNYDAPHPLDIKQLESWIRRTLRSSRYIDPTELGIEPGKSAWRVRISIHVVNHDGNVWDAALLSACAALADLKLPVVEVNRKDGNVRIVDGAEGGIGGDDNGVEAEKKKVQRREGRSLTLGPVPVPLTIAILPSNNNSNDKANKNGKSNPIFLVDPTHLEEDVACGNFVTLVCNTDDEIVDFNKKGSGSRLSLNRISALASMGFGRAKELEPLIVKDR
mmetsp:Transcript_21499/g.44210  ORF Transcript_21499/g.44210 Transcript_21499/m.44210 type:complete len:411 (-) Transcript_21499:20-1252(-)